MDNLTLNKTQIQAALNNLLAQPSGLNTMLEIERCIYHRRTTTKAMAIAKMRNSMPSPDSVLTKVAMDKNDSPYQYPVHKLKADSTFE